MAPCARPPHRRVIARRLARHWRFSSAPAASGAARRSARRPLTVVRASLCLGFKDFKTRIFQSEDHLKLRSQSHPPRSHYQGPASTSCRRNLENRIWGARGGSHAARTAARGDWQKVASSSSRARRWRAASSERGGTGGKRPVAKFLARGKAKAKSWADIKLALRALWLSKTLASRKRVQRCRERRLEQSRAGQLRVST